MGVPHRILRVFINVLDENVFQNPLIFKQPISFSPQQTTLGGVKFTKKPKILLTSI
jgi:hypothetical protein